MLAAHSIDSLGFAPARGGGSGGLGFASDVTALGWDGGPVATRGAYGDKLVAELEFPGKAVHGADAARRDVRAGGAGSAERAPTRTVELRARAVWLAPSTVGYPRGGGGRRRHHEGRLPALDRSRRRGPGQHRAVRGSSPSGSARRSACRGRWSTPAGCPGARQVGPVGQDRQAARVPGARDLGRGPAPRGDARRRRRSSR